MPQLDQKASSVFAGKVVRKDLVRKVKVGANVPVFVLEYLLGKYCATDDSTAIDAGLRIDLLLRSIGMEPSHFDRRTKLLFLVRLLPLCEHNYNLVELGPRGTGKSYAYQELSPYTILLTGPTTVANLFYNMASGKIGLVGI